MSPFTALRAARPANDAPQIDLDPRAERELRALLGADFVAPDPGPAPHPRADRRRNRLLGVGVAAAAVLLTVGALAVTTSFGTTTPAAIGGSAAASSPALRLIPVVWRVRDAAGEAADTWMLFDDQIDLIRPKGDVFLSWSMQGDAIVTKVDGWTEKLSTTEPSVPWLTATTRFVADGDGWVLTDAHGDVTARLVRDGSPPPSAQTLHTVPTVNAAVRERDTDAVAGASVHAVDPAAIVGTWGLPGIDSKDASVTFTRGGGWTARTSCSVLGSNTGGDGAYRLLPSGFVLVTEGFEAGTGCATPAEPVPANAHAITRFSEAGSVDLDGSTLTVYDRAGHRLGMLHRV